MAGMTPGLLRDSRPEHHIPAGGVVRQPQRQRTAPMGSRTIQQPQPRAAVRGCDPKELSV